MMNSFGRFYSSRQGWSGGNRVKYFNSCVLNKLPEDINLNDKNGAFISKHLTKNNIENEYIELFNESKLNSTWYFYYGDEVTLFSSESI